jgi:basic amino acid/polyamine antiporter, APA family
MAGAQPKKLGLWMCVALVMGNMIGSGVFLLPASLAPYGWNAVIGWCVTVAGALALAYVLARLTVAHPAAGGPAGFVQQAFGKLTGFPQQRSAICRSSPPCLAPIPGCQPSC